MKKFSRPLIYGISFIIIFTTYLSAAQGWGISSVYSPTVMTKYPHKKAYYGRSNKLLSDSVRKEKRRVTDSLYKIKKDSLKKVEVKFNHTRDSLLSHGYTATTIATYAAGRYLYAYGKKPRYSSSGSGSSYSSSNTGSFRGSSGRSFRGGSRRGGK